MNLVTKRNAATKMPGPSKSATRLKWARQWHLYLGTLFAPSILFFAFTGSLQLFGLHESRPGDAYQAPAWVQKLASIHKDQVLSKTHGPPPGSAGQRDRPPQTDQGMQPSQSGPAQPAAARQNKERGPNKLTLALKWFFLAAAVGLIFSTFLGIYMAFKFNKSPALVWGMLFFGTATPLALIFMMV